MPVLRHPIARLALALACSLVCLAIRQRLAQAQASDVVVLPMTTTAKSLRIYRNAAPTALAAQLSSLLGLQVKAVSSGADVPRSARVIVDARIVERGSDNVQLEVNVRRASSGRSVATVATGVALTTDIDTLVTQLAIALQPVLERALLAKAYTLPTTVVRGASPGPTAERPAHAADMPTSVQAADVLLLPVVGKAAAGNVEVRGPATEAAVHKLERLGLSVAHSALFEGIANPVNVVAEMRSRSSEHSLMVQILSVDFSYASVLSARGRVRVLLIGDDGLAIFDKTVQTDTLVGARGDRHQALVYRVAEQALDILHPEFVRALKAPAAIARGRS